MNYEIPPLLFSSIHHRNKKQYRDLHQHLHIFTTESQNIRITIYPSWLEEYSCPQRNIYSWAYHVCIENHRDIPLYILHKHWDIIKSNSKITWINTKMTEDDNDPRLDAHQACEYTTYITLDTPSNMVKGYYVMLDETGCMHNIDIPSFNLDNPYNFFPIN